MERSRGWFKRTTQIMLAVIGFTLVIAFNVDSIAIIKKLSNDKEGRAQMVTLATQFSERNSALIDSLRVSKNKNAAADVLNERLNSLDTIRKSLEEDINNSRDILASNWHLPKSVLLDTAEPNTLLEDSYPLKVDTKDKIPAYIIIHKSIDPTLFRESLPDELTIGEPITVNTTYYKFWYCYNNIWGYLLTVLAISLGAPFWFDLLNKLVKLRTSQPAATSDSSGRSTKESPEAVKETLNRVG